MRRLQVALGLGLAVSLAGLGAWLAFASRPKAADASLLTRLQSRVSADAVAYTDCSRAQPGAGVLRLLVIGQSNAGNHGQAAPLGSVAVLIQSAQGCFWARDPLPGATGRGGSIWSHLPAALRAQGVEQAPRFTLLAVDAISIADWVAPGSPLNAALDALLKSLRTRKAMPDLVLLQLGEADAMRGTDAAAFRSGLLALSGVLQATGSSAPLIVARSTVCRSAPSVALRGAVTDAARSNSRIRIGPDTDSLRVAADRVDGCHFSQAGLRSAALLWAASIRGALLGDAAAAPLRNAPARQSHSLQAAPAAAFLEIPLRSAPVGAASRLATPVPFLHACPRDGAVPGDEVHVWSGGDGTRGRGTLAHPFTRRSTSATLVRMASSAGTSPKIMPVIAT